MHQHTWLLGPQFRAVDPFAFMLCRWTRHFDPAISAPASARPALGEYLKRMLARASVQRVLADEKLSAPWA
jgi:glutathione S-transferase